MICNKVVLKTGWQVAYAEEVNMVEKRIQAITLRDPRRINLTFTPYEIKTIRLVIE